MMFLKESDRFEILVFHPTFNMKSSCIAAAVLVAAGHEVPPPDYMMMFNNFKTKHGKVYNGINEDAVRFGIFKANVDVIYATNARNLTFFVGRERIHRPDAGRVCRLLHWAQTSESVERFASFEHARVQRSSLGFFSGLDDARCCNSREESGAVRFLLVLFNNRRSRRCVGPQHR